MKSCQYRIFQQYTVHDSHVPRSWLYISKSLLFYIIQGKPKYIIFFIFYYIFAFCELCMLNCAVCSTKHGLDDMHCNCTYTVTLFCVVCSTKHGLNHMDCNCSYTVYSTYSMGWILCTVTVQCMYTVTLFCVVCSTKHGLKSYAP